MDEKTLYNTPIVNSWGAVTFVNHTGLITPDHKIAAIMLDKDGKPRHLDEANADPLGTKGLIVLVRRTGDQRPTEAEIEMCKAWRKAAAGTNVAFVDFIIMCGGSHYSFASEKVEGPGPKGF